MKKLLSLLAFVCLSTFSPAQYMIDKGNAQLNAGVGLSSWGVPVYVGLDFGVHRDVSLGFEASFRTYNDRWNNYRYHHTIWGASVNGNYHFNSILTIPKKFDFYAGLNIGFYAWSYPDNYYRDRVSGLGIGAQIGGRYYFNDNIGINLELGGGNAFSSGKFGLSFKF